MAIIINKQIYANGWTYMASFLAARWRQSGIDRINYFPIIDPRSVLIAAATQPVTQASLLGNLCGVAYQFYYPNPVNRLLLRRD